MKIWTTTAAILGAVAASPALALEFTGPFGAEGVFYGQLNMGYLSYDDGLRRTGEIADNNISNSRIGLTLNWKLDGDAALKFTIESGLGIRQSNAINATNDLDFQSWRETDFRKLELAYTNKFGVFTLGQGSMTTDNLTEYDLSGSAAGANADFAALSGGFALVRADGTPDSLSVRSVFPSLDGTRRLRVRYETPAFANFTLGAAFGTEVLADGNDNLYYDAALRYTNTVGGVKINGGIGYAVVDRPDDSSIRSFVGSISMLHEETGLSATLAAGAITDGGEYAYVKLGWTGNLTEAGKTSVGVEYYRSSDIGFDDGSGRSWGVVAVQKVDAINTEFFASYREYDADQPGVDYRTANAVFLGAKWKF